MRRGRLARRARRLVVVAWAGAALLVTVDLAAGEAAPAVQPGSDGSATAAAPAPARAQDGDPAPGAPAQVASSAGTEGGALASTEGAPGPRDARDALREQCFEGAELTVLSQLERRKDAIEERAFELDRREEELRSLLALIEERVSRYEEVEQAIARRLAEMDEIERQRTVQLAKVYETMAAPAAAARLAQMDPAVATDLLRTMSKKVAGKVLESLPADQAVSLSARFRRVEGRDGTP